MACETCSVWHHIYCQGISSQTYYALHSSAVVWNCHSCGVTNYTATLFDLTSLVTSNSFSSLQENSSIHSIGGSAGPPLAASAPTYTRREAQTQQSEETTSSSQRQLRLSIRNKQAEVLNLIHSTQVDVLVGTETWLTPDHLNSEYFLTDQYEVFRKDRPDGYGGVLIAVSRQFIFEEVHDMRTDGEGLWVKINFAGQPALYLGAFYRPNQLPEHLDSISESLATLNNTRHKNLLLTGDFNLPYTNWDTPCHVSGQPDAMGDVSIYSTTMVWRTWRRGPHTILAAPSTCWLLTPQPQSTGSKYYHHSPTTTQFSPR